MHYQIYGSIYFRMCNSISATKSKMKSLDDKRFNLYNLRWELYVRILRQNNHLILNALQYICSFTVHQAYRVWRKLCTYIIIHLERKEKSNNLDWMNYMLKISIISQLQHSQVLLPQICNLQGKPCQQMRNI